MTNGSFSSKLTEALLRTQRDDSKTEPGAAPDGSTAAPSDAADGTAAPARASYEPENDIERLILDFRAAPEKYVQWLDREAPLPAGIGALFEKVAERAKGLSVEDASTPGASRNDRLVDATIFFVAKVLLTPGADHYRLLGLSSDAQADDIHNHYRWLRRIFSVTEQSDRGQTVVMRISEAYVMLRDPDRRREYDRRQLGRLGHMYIDDGSVKSYSSSYVDMGLSAAAGRAARTVKRTHPSVVITVALAVVIAVVWLNRDPPPPQLAPDDAEVNNSAFSPAEPDQNIVPEAAESLTATTEPSVTVDSPVPSISSPTDTAAPKDESRSTPDPSDAALLKDVEKFVASAPTSATVTVPSTSSVTVTPVQEAEATKPSTVSTAVPPMQDPVVDTAKQQEIQRLLALGKQLVEEALLTQPVGRNAYEVYQQVLALDPKNEGARIGLLAIQQRYVGMVRNRVQSKRYVEAIELADKGLAIQPDNEQLRVLRALAVEWSSRVVIPAPTQPADELAGTLAGSGVTSEQPPAEVSRPATDGIISDPSSSGVTPPGVESPAHSNADVTSPAGGLAIVPVPPTSIPKPVEPVSESSTVVSSSQSLTSGISEPALLAFISEFVSQYERGELVPFMNLFAEGARTNNQVSKVGIRDDYEKLFESTVSRLMRVRDVRWSYDANSAIGEGDYSLTVLKKGESRPRSYEGSLTFQLVKNLDRLQIKGLYHSQRKTTQ